MPHSTYAKNLMLDAITTYYASAHTAAPNDSGSNEVSGGSYARVAATFAAASNGQRLSTNAPVINIPAGTTITHIGYWTALTGGNFLGYGAISPAAVFTTAGTYTVDNSTDSIS